MKDPCLDRLEVAWLDLVSQKSWKDLGKCLRSILDLHKSYGSLKESEKELNEKVRFLEQSLGDMDFKAAAKVIGDIKHARKHAKLATNDEYGGALRQRLSGKDRAKIRKRNRTPVLSPKDGFSYREMLAGTSDTDGFLTDYMGDDEA